MPKRNSKLLDSIKPPQIASNVSYGHTFRFVSTSGSTTAISPTALLCAAGSLCSATNSWVYAFAGSVKVNRIRMWCPVASQGEAATVSCVFQSGVLGSGTKEYSDTSVSVSNPAYLDVRPPKNSLCSFWNQASSSGIFGLTAPLGTVIDVSMSLILYDDNSALPAVQLINAGTLSQIYYLALDGASTNRYRPISLNSTA